MSKNRLLPLAVAVVLSATTALPALADQAANRCGGAKTIAIAKYARTVFLCHAKALKKNEPVPAPCIAKAVGKLVAGFDKAEARGGCITADEEAAAQAEVDAARSNIQTALNPDTTREALTCASSKLRASAGHIQSRLNCYARTANRSDGPADGCLTRAENKLLAGFARAERRGTCTTNGDEQAIGSTGRNTVETLVRLLSPVCGDGLVGPSQECETGDDAACPTFCDQTCACDFPAVCGDGVAELPEECDDGNTTDGDGCSASCSFENATALCTGITPAQSTAIDAVLITNQFTNPMFLTAPPLDVHRLFVVERSGTIRILNLADNSIDPSAFLDITDLVSQRGEGGLLSMAFDPDYAGNGRFFVTYSNTSGDMVLARYEVDSGNPDAANPGSRQELLVIPHPGANHNGGQLQFSPDGYLYWSVGDGGRGIEAQDSSSMLGKIFRLDVNRSSAPFVTVPTGNPNYVDGSSAPEYMWAKGLRNPWRFSFDSETGDLYIGDVGAGHREEINFAAASSTGGEDYGWNTFEGTRCHRSPCPDPPTGITMPVHEAPHPGACAIMGGYVYRGCAMPDLAGTYFFSDYCGAFVQTFEMSGGVATNLTDRTTDARSTGATFSGVVSWGTDARGELYLINGNNRIYRMDPE